ncbi:MAG: SMP-30/gluconolactonase/LRE family protein [Planctomycetia bacterium]|nr:SMP-30/gluconolactonase/LRE family protein [Planctomycetia bacterium]
MTPTTTARLLVAGDIEADKFLPEGPRLATVLGRDALLWVNIQTAPDAVRGSIHAYFFDSRERRRWTLPARPGFVFPTDAPNTVFVGLEKAVGTLNLATGLWTPFATLPDTNPRTIINDGEIVPGGRAVVFGTKDITFTEPIGHLYLFTLADHQLSMLAPGQTCSNGKVFADGGRTLYDIDTPRRVVTKYRFNVENRELFEAGIAVDLRSHEAFPDGMCDAGDGTVIVAFYNPHRGGAGVAEQYRLGTGELLHRWETPGSPRVTCPLLAQRPDGVKLILTTATEGMPATLRADSPHAGQIFVADTVFPEAPAAEIVRL